VSRVAVFFTGGTISMRPDAAAGGAVPTLRGDEILARTTGLDEIADVEGIDWGLVPASHLSFAQILDLARAVDSALARDDVDGAVVVQGTDTIEETAFALDLLLGGDKPVAVTGAMRNADEDGYDGPRNVRGAVRVAASRAARGVGAVVVLGDAVLPPDDAIKVHTDAYAAFAAPNAGPLGSVTDATLRLSSRRGYRRMLPRIPDAAAEPVVLLTAVVASGGELLRAARSIEPRGVVVAATGAGNTDPDLLAAAREAMADGLPVILVSRALAGAARPAYAFPGGGVEWARAGVLFAGTLSGSKARVALALALGADVAGNDLRDLLAGA
jgi:L-asparaginase